MLTYETKHDMILTVTGNNVKFEKERRRYESLFDRNAFDQRCDPDNVYE